MGARKHRFTKGLRRLRRNWHKLTGRKNRRALRRGAVMALVAIVVVATFVAGRDVRNVNYATLLNTIAKGESNGDYNAYYGGAGKAAINFTAMTVGEVMEWQQVYVANGSPSSAVGKYQFVSTTLQGLVRELRINMSARFDATLQDKLAIRLLERRGVNAYMDGKISREQLAHNLSQEWAALPRVLGDHPEASYYAGDGLNHVKITIAELLAAIDSLHAA